MKIKDVINDLYLFYNWTVASHYKDNVYARHIDKLATELTRIKLGQINNLCVSMPPRHSKSSMVTLAYPLWLIFQDPNLNILIINSEGGLSERFGIELREGVREYGGYFNVYLSDIKHSSTYLMFEDSNGELYGGSIRLTGSNGSITGQDADYLIIDDPYKGFEDITPTLLQKKIDWFNTLIIQRIEPETRLIILHTRWHSLDLQGYLHDNYPDKYNFISFPAIKQDGTPLWPERYSLKLLEEKQEQMGERLFEAIYQQKPLDTTSDFFDLTRINWDNNITEPGDLSVRAWDIASSDNIKGKRNDYTCGIYMQHQKGDHYLINGMIHGQYGKNTKNRIVETAHIDGVNTHIVIETGVAAAGQLLYDEWEQQLPGYMVEQAKPITSKVDRATPLQNAIYDGKITINLPDKERQLLMQEFESFPNGEHDDIVDACAHAYNFLSNRFNTSEPTLELLEL